VRPREKSTVRRRRGEGACVCWIPFCICHCFLGRGATPQAARASIIGERRRRRPIDKYMEVRTSIHKGEIQLEIMSTKRAQYVQVDI